MALIPGSPVATHMSSPFCQLRLGLLCKRELRLCPRTLLKCNISGASGLLTQVPCCAAQNKLNINDWSSVQSLFDKLNKQMEKTQKAADSLGAPRVYIKMLVELEVCCQVP